VLQRQLFNMYQRRKRRLSGWTPAELNPIAWYKGDGNALDAIGNHDGTWVGTEAYTDGPTGQAFDFDGVSVNQRITATPYTNSIDRTTGFTVAAWIRLRGPMVDYGELSFSTGDIPTFSLVSPGLNYNISGRFRDAAAVNRTTAAYTMPANVWVHVALVLGPSIGTLWINGEAYSSTPTHTSSYTLADSTFFLGGYRAIASKPSNPVNIDDVLIFDRALTPLEISTLYNESINKNGEAW